MQISNDSSIRGEYFNQNTENAILQYIAIYTGSNEQGYKNELFTTHIQKPLNELVEYTIYDLCHDFGTDSFNEIKQELTIHLLEQLPMYKQENGKAFSYFNVIGRNYIKQRSKKQYRKTHCDIPLENVDTNKNILNDSFNAYKAADNNEFLDKFIAHIDTNLEYYFINTVEQDVANAILIILRKRDIIENANKKIVFVYIREITMAKPHIISKILKIFKNLYTVMLNTYINKDTIHTLSEAELIKIRNS